MCEYFIFWRKFTEKLPFKNAHRKLNKFAKSNVRLKKNYLSKKSTLSSKSSFT